MIGKNESGLGRRQAGIGKTNMGKRLVALGPARDLGKPLGGDAYSPRRTPRLIAVLGSGAVLDQAAARNHQLFHGIATRRVFRTNAHSLRPSAFDSSSSSVLM
ncbi:MAG: hypothetical protein ACREM8_08080, partial [Vulcanimicrobiaceae bacterium]